MIGVQEFLAFMRRKVAQLEHLIQILGRQWRRVGRTRYLGDETSVLSERLGESQTRARGPGIEDTAKDLLVTGDSLLASSTLARFIHRCDCRG